MTPTPRLQPSSMWGVFLQVDFLMSGLMVLKERIDATEALIAIDLDNRRNELVAFDLVSGCQACRVQALGRAANDIVLQAAAVLSHSVGKGGGGRGASPSVTWA